MDFLDELIPKALRMDLSISRLGQIASVLYAAQKASVRAKRSPFVHQKEFLYQKKDECLRTLCALLSEDSHGLIWGWGEDHSLYVPVHVLFIDLPTGQVSFHSFLRHAGPDYPKKWDGTSVSDQRIAKFCQELIG